MMLTKTSGGAAQSRPPRQRRSQAAGGRSLDRRDFLKRSGLVAGGAAFATQLPYNMMGKARAADDAKKVVEVKRTVCTHCSVGCAIDAVVENGVWVRQEPVFDSPINLGAHCAKGSSVREHGMTHDSRRLRYPMKLVRGKYTRIGWDQAINEIGDKLLAIRKDSGPDSVFWVGSSKHNNEQAYLMRKFVSMFGTNNCDHQARICHSTTVAGVANTWGYGAMTNSYNDMSNTKCALYIGSNAAEAHPVSMLHMLHAKEIGAKMIVVDPRYTRTAAKADEYVRIRSGTDIPFLFGMLHHIFKNGWEDKQYINDRVYGMDKVREEVMAKWTPDNVEEACGVPEAQVYKVAEMMAKNRPSTLVWCMGQTQHTIGNAIVRASCIVQLALGNIGVSGGGTNIFRGHDNVQGATDVGPNPDSLPGYYGIAASAWKHFCAGWGVDYEWLKQQFASQAMMEKPGMTVSRWIDGVMEKNELIDQDNNLKAIVFWGHAPNSQTRGFEMKTAMEKVDLMVIIDPYPSASAVIPDRQEGVYLLPACTQFETSGSATASNRSLQNLHNFLGPLFFVSLLVMFFTFLRNNWPRSWDFYWLFHLGGLIGKKHIPSGKYNAGEKIWFWGGVLVLGLVVSLSGLVLDFPNFDQTRQTMQLANIVHLIATSLFMVGAFSHIYLGTLGVAGAYKGMKTGVVDEEWAKEHHELWYEDIKAGKVDATLLESRPIAAHPASGPAD